MFCVVTYTTTLRTSGTRVFCVVIRVKVMGSRVKDMSTIILTQTVTVLIESTTTLCSCCNSVLCCDLEHNNFAHKWYEGVLCCD